MTSNETGYEYVTMKLGLKEIEKELLEDINWNLTNNLKSVLLNYYDIILVNFTEPHTHEYRLESYEAKIKLSNKKEKYLIERNHLISPEFKLSPYVLVKLSNGKLGYIHTCNFDPVEFDSQETIKTKLFDFLLEHCTL